MSFIPIPLLAHRSDGLFSISFLLLSWRELQAERLKTGQGARVCGPWFYRKAVGWHLGGVFLVLLVCLLLKNGIRVCKRLKEREEDLFPGFGCIGLGLVQGVRWLIQVTKVAITNKRRMWNLGGFGGFGFGKAVSQSVCILRCCSFLGCWLAECPARRYLDWLSGYLFVFLLSSERGRMAICSTLG
jgi:hypothetical protein